MFVYYKQYNFQQKTVTKVPREAHGDEIDYSNINFCRIRVQSVSTSRCKRFAGKSIAPTVLYCAYRTIDVVYSGFWWSFIIINHYREQHITVYWVKFSISTEIYVEKCHTLMSLQPRPSDTLLCTRTQYQVWPSTKCHIVMDRKLLTWKLLTWQANTRKWLPLLNLFIEYSILKTDFRD